MTKKITDLVALTAPAIADLLEIVDDVAGTATSKKIVLSDLWKVVNSFTATTDPQGGDYIPMYSTSDSAIRRTLISDLVDNALPEIAFSFTADGSAYYVAHEAMTLTTEYAGGTGTLAYARSPSTDTATFSSTSLPITLASGEALRVTVSSISTFKAVTLERSA